MDYGRIVPHEETWKGMEECVKLGLTKHIGLSNFTEAQVIPYTLYTNIRSIFAPI